MNIDFCFMLLNFLKLIITMFFVSVDSVSLQVLFYCREENFQNTLVDFYFTWVFLQTKTFNIYWYVLDICLLHI